MAEFFAELERHVLPASIASLSRTKQTVPTESCFGGVFVGSKGVEWPYSRSRPMEGVLQICTQDLPYRPKELEKIALIQLFCLCQEALKGHPVFPDVDDDGWFLVRTYETLTGLQPIARPNRSQIKPCRILWTLVSNEIPSYPDDIEFIDGDKRDRFYKLDDWADLLAHSYSKHARTKVGGWPVSRQSGLNHKGYAIQIGSEEKANFMWGDNGVAVLYHHREKWLLDWDCY